jgi:branched-chain amino acid transport system ATP-binding protein
MFEIRNLTVAYKGVVAIKDANLDVAAGRMVAIVGANGAGKTTLLNTISGVVKSSGGTIRFDGRQIAGLPGHKVAQMGIVQVPEGRQILAPLTVEENLRLGHLAAQDRSQNINQDLQRVLELFPMLRESLYRPAGRLSGGQQQMLAIGRALMGHPRLLLLDEPSLGLAPVIVGQVFGMLQKLHADGLTILLVEQNARRALSVSSYAYVMERGRMVKEGESEALIEDTAVIAHYLGQKPSDNPTAVRSP